MTTTRKGRGASTSGRKHEMASHAAGVHKQVVTSGGGTVRGRGSAAVPAAKGKHTIVEHDTREAATTDFPRGMKG
jgi:hypothetical protein